MSEPKPKKKVKRLRKVTSQIQQALDELSMLMQDESLKSTKRADLSMARLNCLQSLMLTRSEEAKARLRFADTDSLTKENADLKAEITRLRGSNTTVPVANIEESFEARLARLKEVQS